MGLAFYYFPYSSQQPCSLKIIALILLLWKLRPREIKCFSKCLYLSMAPKLFLLHVTNFLWKSIFIGWVLQTLRWSLRAEYLSQINLCRREKEEAGIGRGRSQTKVQAQQSFCRYQGGHKKVYDPQSVPCGIGCHAGPCGGNSLQRSPTFH